MDGQKRKRGRPAIIEVGAENNGSNYTRRSLVNQMYQDLAIQGLREIGFSYSTKAAKKHFGGEVLEQLGRMIKQDRCTLEKFSDVARIVSRELFYKHCTVKEAKRFVQAGRKDEWKHPAYWPECSPEEWDRLFKEAASKIEKGGIV